MRYISFIIISCLISTAAFTQAVDSTSVKRYFAKNTVKDQIVMKDFVLDQAFIKVFCVYGLPSTHCTFPSSKPIQCPSGYKYSITISAANIVEDANNIEKCNYHTKIEEVDLTPIPNEGYQISFKNAYGASSKETCLVDTTAAIKIYYTIYCNRRFGLDDA